MAPDLIIGTRGSQLALWQARWIKAAILARDPSLQIELEIIKTKGDKIIDVPLAKVGGKGLFVKEIEEALLTGRADLAVHSMKDMPAELPEGLCIAAVPQRENPQDVLIAKDHKKLSQLPHGARVGTSSLRRAAQLKHQRPDIRIVPLRGNLDTRLRKLDSEDIDAIVLAAAGVKRLNLEERVTEYLDPSIVLPAVGQGALCVEARSYDAKTRKRLTQLDHEPTRTVVMGERAFLHRLQGGCQVPIAAHGQLKGSRFSMVGLVADLEGRKVIKDTLSGPCAEAEQIGQDLAQKLLDLGAQTLLDQLKDMVNLDYGS